MRSRGLVKLGAALLATLVLGYLVSRQLKLSDLAQLWRAADLRLLGLGFLGYGLANVLRAHRFRALTGDRIPTLMLLRMVLIQNFLNTFLPFRAGEVSYLVMVHRTGAVKPGENLASLLGARLLDLVAALLIPLAVLPMSRAWSAQDRPLGWFVAIAAIGVAVPALGVWRAAPVAGWLTKRAEASSGLWARGLTTGGEALLALAELRRGHRLGRVALLTAGCWVLLYLAGYVSLLGVGVSVPFWDGLFAYSFPMIVSMTPIYMLGGFGVFEGSIGFGLHLVGVPTPIAMAGALLLHVSELTFVTALAPLGLRVARNSGAPLERPS